MIAVMLTMARNKKELETELQIFEQHYGNPPGIIVVRKDLPFELRSGHLAKRFHKIALMDFNDFWEMHAEQLDFGEHYEPRDVLTMRVCDYCHKKTRISTAGCDHCDVEDK